MYAHNSSTDDMSSNGLIDYSVDPHWTTLNNLNPITALPVPGETLWSNGCVKSHQKTVYGKSFFTQFNNHCSNIGNFDSPTVMKYPRIFQPVILQHHPEYSTRMLPQIQDLRHKILLDRELVPIDDEERRENTNSVHNLDSYGKIDKEVNGKFYKRVFQFQFSISESVKENNKFLSRPDSEVTSESFTLNNHQGNLQPTSSALKATKLDFPYAPGYYGQSVNRQLFQNRHYNTSKSGTENLSLEEQTHSSIDPKAHKDPMPNWLLPKNENTPLYNRTGLTQPYDAEFTHWTDSLSFNRLKPKNDLTSDQFFSKRSAFWNPMFALENSKNSFGNIDHIFDINSQRPSVLSNGNSFRSYYPSLEKKTMSKKLNACPYCNRSNSSPAQLKIHLRIHTGERPYVCDIVGCDKTFTRNEELTRHLKIHSGDRPYICNVCQRRFGRKDHLTKHEVTHRSASDKKVHICLVSGCKQRYTRSDALARHRWNVHFIRPQERNIGSRKNQARKKLQN